MSLAMRRFCLCLALLCVLPVRPAAVSTRGGAEQNWGPELPASMLRSLEAVTARSLRAHLSFLAADALQGRPTPSVGQDVAAEYIASQFRRAGLEAAGSQDYFQPVAMLAVRPDRESFRFQVVRGEEKLTVPPESFSMNTVAPMEFERAPVVRVLPDPESLRRFDTLAGKAAVVQISRDGAGTGVSDARRAAFLRRIRDLAPRLLILADPHQHDMADYFATPRLRAASEAFPTDAGRVPVAVVSDPAFAQLVGGLPVGETRAILSLRLRERAPEERTLRNVLGLLRGSDPVLSETCVLLTAHYDGTGPQLWVTDDPIWNAANDNGSGTAAVLEIAAALASLESRPARSVLFACFFGEEWGLLGSRHYARHPAIPLRNTVAVINLEQLGRTDAPEGVRKGKASLTGFDYTDMGEVFQWAGAQIGVEITSRERDSDTYFGASDNIVFAEAGIPAHTLCVSYVYPDYHGPGDHWEKIDYENMETVVRVAALAVLKLAQSERVPKWNPSHPRANRFRQAERNGGVR